MSKDTPLQPGEPGKAYHESIRLRQHAMAHPDIESANTNLSRLLETEVRLNEDTIVDIVSQLFDKKQFSLVTTCRGTGVWCCALYLIGTKAASSQYLVSGAGTTPFNAAANLFGDIRATSSVFKL